jgi:ribosome-associated toxin RatA of RatAB toxin-antitoxin module
MWQFTPLDNNSCKINFSLNYNFSNIIMEKIFSPVFSHITNTIIDYFLMEANRCKLK